LNYINQHEYLVYQDSKGRYNKVKSLQWLVTRSYYAKLIAIKRVTSNKGKKENYKGVTGVSRSPDSEKH
jgi:RNA-directed DNA polymerase